MKLDDLNPIAAPQALVFAVDNVIKKLQTERREETEHPGAIKALTAEIEKFKEFKDVLDNRLNAKVVWSTMSKKSKDRLPTTMHVKDYLS